MQSSDSFQHGLSLAKRNLSCAIGLPGAEGLDIDDCLIQLANWSDAIHGFTKRLEPQFQADPDRFENSESRFRMLCLITYLQRDLGIRYDAVWKDIPLETEALFDDSRRLFLHGIIQQKQGTCNSLPVLVTAIGRCLGYPLYLAKAMGHLFVRWEDTSDRFNIEATSLGFQARDDAYYYTWPKPIPEKTFRQGFLLKNLTEDQENAAFFALRGHCQLDNLRFDEALIDYYAAQVEDSADPNYSGFAAVATIIAKVHTGSLQFEMDGDSNIVNILEQTPYGPTRRMPTHTERWAVPLARTQYRLILRGQAEQATDAALAAH